MTQNISFVTFVTTYNLYTNFWFNQKDVTVSALEVGCKLLTVVHSFNKLSHLTALQVEIGRPPPFSVLCWRICLEKIKKNLVLWNCFSLGIHSLLKENKPGNLGVAILHHLLSPLTWCFSNLLFARFFRFYNENIHWGVFYMLNLNRPPSYLRTPGLFKIWKVSKSNFQLQDYCHCGPPPLLVLAHVNVRCHGGFSFLPGSCAQNSERSHLLPPGENNREITVIEKYIDGTVPTNWFIRTLY